ncbi:MAG: response regulator [Acidimicrobiia bacterium]|nr:response regulator [Acidimicrobiia bacterium]
MSFVKVLIVDDSPTDLMILSALLNQAGDYQVTQATDGFKALDALSQGLPDICLVDFDMPGMNGLEFVGRARSEYSDLTFIVISGVPASDIASAALAVGVHTIISKADIDSRLLDREIEAAMAARLQ